MKKLLAVLFALFGVCTIASCGNKEDKPNDNPPVENPPVDTPTEKTQYTVKFNSNGGSTVADAKSDKTTGKVTKPADPTKSFYTFDGWYKEEACTTAFDFNAEVTADVTAYAKWTLIEESMSYADFMAAEAGDDAIIEGYIAAKQSWWADKATMYLTTDTAGEGYFLYEFACSEEEYNNVYKIGTKIQVYGAVATYAGEIEIMGDSIDYDLTNVIEDAPKMPNTIIDVTSSVKNEDLIDNQNARFTATLKVAEYTTTDQNTGVAASKAYGYAGDAPTGDLYLTLVDASGNELACCVEQYLTSCYADVKAVVETLTVGDTVEIEGFMYWWNGANPHITSIKKADADVMYETFMSTADGEEVEVAGFLVAKTSWWNGKTNLYIAGGQSTMDFTSAEGYYVYEYECTEEVYNTLTLSSSIYVKVKGTKASYAGMQEIVDATVEIVTAPEGYGPNQMLINYTMGNYSGITLDQLNENHMSSIFIGQFTLAEYTTTDQNTTVATSKAYGYKGDAPTDDLYFTLVDEDGNELNCCIEAYIDYEALDGEEFKDNLYESVMNLKVGDTVMISGVMYWWNGPNPHIIMVQVVPQEAK